MSIIMKRSASVRRVPFHRVNSEDMRAVLGQIRHAAAPLGEPSKQVHYAAHAVKAKDSEITPIPEADTLSENGAEPQQDSDKTAAAPRPRYKIKAEDMRATMNTALTSKEVRSNNKRLFRTSYMEKLRDRYHFLPATRSQSRLNLGLPAVAASHTE